MEVQIRSDLVHIILSHLLSLHLKNILNEVAEAILCLEMTNSYHSTI